MRRLIVEEVESFRRMVSFFLSFSPSLPLLLSLSHSESEETDITPFRVNRYDLRYLQSNNNNSNPPLFINIKMLLPLLHPLNNPTDKEQHPQSHRGTRFSLHLNRCKRKRNIGGRFMELEVWAVRVREKKYRVMNSRGSCNMVDINGAIIVWNGRGEKRENRIFFRLGKRGMKWTLRGDLLSGTYPSYTVFERCYLY